MENKKKKGVLGIFNLFDIILILIAIAIAAALFFLGRGSTGTITGNQQTQIEVRYTVELKEVDNGTADNIKPGDQVIDKVKKYSIGTVESVELVPARKSVADEETGVKNFAEIPNQQNAIVVIKALASETDRDIIIDGGYVIKAGMEVNARMPGFNAVGYIIDVERSDAE